MTPTHLEFHDRAARGARRRRPWVATPYAGEQLMRGGDSEVAAIDRVRLALAALGHDAEILNTEESTHTAELAAEAARCELGQIVKTLVAYVAGAPMLVLVPGDRRLDDRLLAARFGVGRKQVKLADAGQVLELTGYPIGGVSPFGMPTALPVLMDASFERFEVVWVAAGTATAILPIGRAALARYVDAEDAPITSGPPLTP